MKTRMTLPLTALAAIIALAVLLTLAAPATAGDIGFGVVVGEPIGGSAKLWLDDRLAGDFGAGFSEGNAAFWGDALWHDWTLLPQPKEGRLGLYLGAGPQLRTGDDERFGIRTIAGVSYRLAGHPLEFFAEAGPLFRLTQGGHVDAVGGAGLRVYVGKMSKR